MSNLEVANVRSGGFEGFRDLLVENDVDLPIFFSDLGMEESWLNLPEMLLPVSLYRRGLSLAAIYTNQPHFGLLMSQRHTLKKLGATGYLMKYSDTVGQSIMCLDKYLRLHDSSSKARLEIQGGVALWTVNFTTLREESAIQQVELGIGYAVKIIRIITSETWNPDVVYFEHSQPKCTKIYESVFKCPVLFDQVVNGLEFPEKLLRTKLPSSDPNLFNIIQFYIDETKKNNRSDFIDKVRLSIQLGFESGKPSLEATAQEFAMSMTQFQRKLKCFDANFQTILQEVRLATACKYLANTDMSLATISSLLAYAAPSVFSRAFKKNLKVSPREWRLQNKT